MKNKSFTLIEILIVIIIIGLIAGTIIVSTASSLDQASSAKAHTFSTNAKKQMMFNIHQEWRFDEGSGSTTYDINKSSNLGTLVSFSNVAAGGGDSGVSGWLSKEYCVSGTCLNFNGGELAYVDIIDTGRLPLFTLSTWIYNVSGGDDRHAILRTHWEAVFENICFYASFANLYWRCSTGSKIKYNQWTYIVTVWDGTHISHYINGEFNWKDGSASSGSSNSFTTIAGYSGRRMKGRLDEMIIYNKNLSLSEVRQNYIAGLDSLLAQGGISKEEYSQRLQELAKK